MYVSAEKKESTKTWSSIKWCNEWTDGERT